MMMTGALDAGCELRGSLSAQATAAPLAVFFFLALSLDGDVRAIRGEDSVGDERHDEQD